MENKNPTIRIRKKETEVDLLGAKPEEVKHLCVYSDNKNSDLSLLADYPNVETLFINGDFANVDGISELKALEELLIRLETAADFTNVRVPGLKKLTVYQQINEGVPGLLTEGVEYLALKEMRKLSDLSFVESASGLRKLCLMYLPAVESLPDFGKLPNLYALKLYELHKLNDIGSLASSNVKYLSVDLAADKLSGTKIAEVLLQMEKLERADIQLDRSSDRRTNVVENQFKKAGKDHLLSDLISMDEWLKL